MNSAREKAVKDWLLASGEDLKCADLLFTNSFFSKALYHLQQSNEKLVKGLLLSLGFLTPRRAKEDWRVKSVLGFLPKQPISYRHRTLQSLLADLKKIAPRIESLLTVLKDSGWDQKMIEAHSIIRKSKKGIQKLKKRSFNLIEKEEQLHKEIRAAEAILNGFDKTINKVNDEIDKLDFPEIVRMATIIATRIRSSTNTEPPPFREIKKRVIQTLKLSVLVSLSASMGSILDPLESVTRYPNSKQAPFNESNPYVKQFKGLRDVVRLCLEKTEKAILL